MANNRYRKAPLSGNLQVRGPMAIQVSRCHISFLSLIHILSYCLNKARGNCLKINFIFIMKGNLFTNLELRQSADLIHQRDDFPFAGV